MSSDTRHNIKYNQLVHSIKCNDSCPWQLSLVVCESFSISILYVIFPPAPRLRSPTIRPCWSDSTPIMCFTCHYRWHRSGALWGKPQGADVM